MWTWLCLLPKSRVEICLTWDNLFIYHRVSAITTWILVFEKFMLELKRFCYFFLLWMGRIDENGTVKVAEKMPSKAFCSVHPIKNGEKANGSSVFFFVRREITNEKCRLNFTRLFVFFFSRFIRTFHAEIYTPIYLFLMPWNDFEMCSSSYSSNCLFGVCVCVFFYSCHLSILAIFKREKIE